MRPPTIQPERTDYTLPEYWSLDAESETKLEFHGGVIRMMSGSTRNHAVICANVGASLHQALQGKNCTPFGGELKVATPNLDAIMFPDAMVACGDEELAPGRQDTLLNPTLIVEVLSPSTMTYDYIEKFDRYTKIPSLKEYVLVAQDRYRVEVRSAHEGWGQVHVYSGSEAMIHLESIGLSLPLIYWYQRIEFP